VFVYMILEVLFIYIFCTLCTMQILNKYVSVNV